MNGLGLSRSIVVAWLAACAPACSFPDFQADQGDMPDGDAALDVVGLDTFVDSGTLDSATDGDGATTDAPLDGDAIGTCGVPPTLHPPGFTGPYCPFMADAGTTSCAPGQTCCEYPVGAPSTCVARGTMCPTMGGVSAVSWECDAPSQCGGGAMCCGNGTPMVRPGCSYFEVRPAQGTSCAATCGTGQYVVCEANSDCPTGRTCTPLKSEGQSIGFCN